MRKFFKIFVILIQICVASCLLALGAFLWRLHKAPIDINPLIPYLVQATTSSENKISIKTAQIQWKNWKHPIEIVGEEFQAFDEKDNLILSVPKMAVSFSIPALLRGFIAPRTISFYKPSLNIKINKEGKVEEKTKAEEEEPLLQVKSIVHLLKEEKHLSKFSLIKAQIKITDEMHNAVWEMPDVNLTYSNSFKKKNIKGSVVLKMRKKQELTLDIAGRWKNRQKELDLSVGIKNLDLKASRAAQKYPYLKNFTTPISLLLETRINMKPLIKTASFSDWPRMIDKINFNLSGKEGIINLPAPVLARYDLESFEIVGAWFNAGNDFNISSFKVKTQSDAFATGSFSVSGIAEAVKNKQWKSIRSRLQATAENVSLQYLPDYWPASIGPSVHHWIKENIKKGLATKADFDLHFVGLEEGGIDAEKIIGTVFVQDATVRYLDDMPVVKNASGNLDFTRDVITINLDTGNTKSIEVQEGSKLSFLDLTKEVSSMDLDLNLTGSVPDILTVLDSPCLGLAKEIGIKPENTTGKAQGNLKISLPLGDAFKSIEDVNIKATAEVLNADINDIALGYGLQDAILKINLDNKSLNLEGTSLFYGAATDYSLFLTFDKTQELLSDIKLHIDLNDKARASLGYPAILNEEMIAGFTPMDLTFKTFNTGKGVLDIQADLTQGVINIPQIGWKKQAGIKGAVDFKMLLENNKPTEIPLISATDNDDTKIKGSVSFTPSKKVQKIAFNQIKTKRTDAHLDIDFTKESTTFTLEGSELDISQLTSNSGSSYASSAPAPAPVSTKESQTKEKAKKIFIKALVDKMWLSTKGYAQDNSVSAVYNSGWENVEAFGSVGQEKVSYSFSLLPTEKKNEYSVFMTSKDAGYVLKTFDFISTVKGGELELKGLYVPKVGSKGEIKISKFYLQEDKIYTHILMLTSLTGIIDSFRGEGLYFDKAEIPYETDNSRLEIKDAVISGASLGVTLKGKYYRDTGYLNVRGSLIPFYTLNSFLGKIPLIGRIFSGEKGGGLIAPTYTIKGKLPSPTISVNAFSALAPGAIRSFFGVLSSDDSDLSKMPPTPSEIKKEETVFKPLNPEEETELQDLLHRDERNKKPQKETELMDKLHRE